MDAKTGSSHERLAGQYKRSSSTNGDQQQFLTFHVEEWDPRYLHSCFGIEAIHCEATLASLPRFVWPLGAVSRLRWVRAILQPEWAEHPDRAVGLKQARFKATAFCFGYIYPKKEGKAVQLLRCFRSDPLSEVCFSLSLAC